jgi:hypothetical protein
VALAAFYLAGNPEIGVLPFSGCAHRDCSEA